MKFDKLIADLRAAYRASEDCTSRATNRHVICRLPLYMRGAWSYYIDMNTMSSMLLCILGGLVLGGATYPIWTWLLSRTRGGRR